MKKGISLVALIITIIVLIILTAAVIWTSGDSPEQAKLSVFYNDVTVIQEAVTTKTLTNYVDAALETGGANASVSKWAGILSNKEVTGKPVNDLFEDGEKVYYFLEGAGKELGLGLNDAKMAEFCVEPETGTVYHINGVSYSQDEDTKVSAYNRLNNAETVNETSIAIASYTLGKNGGEDVTLLEDTEANTYGYVAPTNP